MNINDKQLKNDDHFDNHTEVKTMTMEQLEDIHRSKPSLLRINADNQDKKFMCLFWSIFLLFVLIMIIIAKTLPSVLVDIKNSTQLRGTIAQNCINPNYFEGNVLTCQDNQGTAWAVGIVARKLRALNQFVFFYLVIKPTDLTKAINLDQNVTYTLFDIKQQYNATGTALVKQNTQNNFTTRFTFSSAGAQQYRQNKRKVGYKKFVGFINDFSSQNIYLNMKFLGPYEQFNSQTNFQIQGYKISAGFTKFTIALRYVFFALSILAAIRYILQYRSIPVEDRIIEQKLICGLSILLIFFNDPFYAITILKENLASSFFSTLFVVSFVVFLTFLWVIFTDRILYQQGQKQTKQITLIKLGYHIVLFLLLIILYMLYASQRINDHPIISSDSLTTSKYIGMEIAVSVWFALIAAYYVIQMIRICMKQGKRLYRNELFLMYSFFFEVALTAFIFTDNSLGAYNYNGTTIIFLYGGLNMYTWSLQYLYSPYKQIDPQTGQAKNIHNRMDQLMSVGTVEFRDVNIDLDDNNSDFVSRKVQNQKQGQDRRQHGYQYYQPQQNVVTTKTGNRQQPSREPQGNEVDNFSLQDQNQYNNKGNTQNDYQLKYQQKPQIVNPQFLKKKQPYQQGVSNKKSIDFFDSNEVERFNKNNPNLVQNKQHDQNIEQIELVQSQIDTQTVRSELPQIVTLSHEYQEQKKPKKEEDQFGQFSLQ